MNADGTWPPSVGELVSSGALGTNLGFLTSIAFHRAGTVPWWLCTASLARTPPGQLFLDNGAAASAGTSLDFREALFRALGEAFERYSALSAPVETRRSPIPLTVGLARCDPTEPCADSYKQVPADAEFMSVSVRRLSDDSTVWIPAGFVHLTYWGSDDEPPVAVPISTGLAFAPSAVGAIWRGLCEVAERDALMTMWWTRSGHRRIAHGDGGATGALGDRLRRAAESRFRIRLFDMATDFGAPCVFCLLESDRQPKFSVGACCREDPVSAACKAIDEAFSGRLYVMSLERANRAWRDGIPQSPHDVHSLEDHLLFYADDRNAPAFEFLDDAPIVPFEEYCAQSTWAPPTSVNDLPELGERLGQLGMEILWADLTAPEVAPYGRVAKVIVPQMVPLAPDHSTRWLATPRLRSAMTRAGIATGQLNPYPHPFA